MHFEIVSHKLVDLWLAREPKTYTNFKVGYDGRANCVCLDLVLKPKDLDHGDDGMDGFELLNVYGIYGCF